MKHREVMMTHTLVRKHCEVMIVRILVIKHYEVMMTRTLVRKNAMRLVMKNCSYETLQYMFQKSFICIQIMA